MVVGWFCLNMINHFSGGCVCDLYYSHVLIVMNGFNVDIKRFWYDCKAVGEVIWIRLLVVFRLLKPEISLGVVIGFDLTCLTTEWDKKWKRLSAHFQPFFSALSAYRNNFRLKIPYFKVLRHKICSLILIYN